jgi:hypothetical protein
MKKAIPIFIISAIGASLSLAVLGCIAGFALLSALDPNNAYADSLTPQSILRKNDRLEVIISLDQNGPTAFTYKYDYGDGKK